MSSVDYFYSKRRGGGRRLNSIPWIDTIHTLAQLPPCLATCTQQEPVTTCIQHLANPPAPMTPPATADATVPCSETPPLVPLGRMHQKHNRTRTQAKNVLVSGILHRIKFCDTTGESNSILQLRPPHKPTQRTRVQRGRAAASLTRGTILQGLVINRGGLVLSTPSSELLVRADGRAGKHQVQKRST